MHTKRLNTLKIWVQSRVGAIPRLPKYKFINKYCARNRITILFGNFMMQLML